MFKNKNEINLILFFSTIFGIISIYFFGDSYLDNEWGNMLSILERENILSIRRVQGEYVPNIFMPPFYPLFLFVLKKFLFGHDILLITLQFIQLFLFLLAIIVFNKTLASLFSRNLSSFGTLIFAFYPLNIYSVGQTSSVTIQVFFITCIFYSFIKIYETYSFKNIVFFSISSGLLMLLRGEFFLFYFLSLAYLFLKSKNYKTVILSVLITLLTVSPYLWRNYKVFDLITITKSSGFNLLKGNNPLSIVEGTPLSAEAYEIMDAVPGLEDEINNLGPTKDYDLIIDKIFLHKALDFIEKDPKRYIALYGKKFLSFAFIDITSTYPNYYSFLHIIPKIILSITTLLSIILLFRFQINITNFFILYYISNIGLFSFFFILPRYSLSLLPVQIILSILLIKKTRFLK